MKIMIAGSRGLKHAQTVEAVVLRIKERGDEILVGDAHGIDATVIKYCKLHNVKLTVHVPSGKTQRNGYDCNTIRAGKTYTERDRYMVNQADFGVVIWDGQSPGTRKGFEYMRKLGKQAHVWCNNKWSSQ